MKKVELITENVIEKIITGIENASSIYILTAFIMKSGVELLEPYLKQAAERGADIKICTGDYLYVTQPYGLKKLVSIHRDIEARLWCSQGISFHPKAFIFQNEHNGIFIIGSSNLSRSALTTGVEWNIALEKTAEPITFEEAVEQFIQLFHHEQTIPLNFETIASYQRNYEKFHKANPKVVEKLYELDEETLMFPLND